jgi:predicted phage terminase large subunit-like protein
MLSRNRSTCGVKPYVRATCNPDADSWVAKFIEWWIDQDTGFPIEERAGKLRWFIRMHGNVIWADSREELIKLYPQSIPKSVTFIPVKLSDNKILEEKDPGYRANLQALNFVDNERLEKGNWKIKPEAGTMFREEWLPVIDFREVPYNPQDLNYVRWWDTAATAQSKDSKDPDWCSGLLMAEHAGRYYIYDVQHFRETPAGVYRKIEHIRDVDGKNVTIGMEQEPGSAAKREIDALKTTMFKGYSFHAETSSGSKVVRAKTFSAACENGLVYLIRGHWNHEFIQELVNFPDPKWHDDQVDSATGAFNYLSRKGAKKKFDVSQMFPSKNR